MQLKAVDSLIKLYEKHLTSEGFASPIKGTLFQLTEQNLPWNVRICMFDL